MHDRQYDISSRKARGERFCPFIKHPLPECYVSNLNSQNIGLALKYCQGNFEDCNVYQRHSGTIGGPAGEGRGP